MRNKINNEYRNSDYERWQGQDFVLGIEILRSKSVKCSCDLCDNMNGIYPKAFMFQGWCEECKCIQMPVMLEGEAYVDYLLSGIIPQSLVVKTIPEKALNYIKRNYNELREYYWVDKLLKLK